MEPGRPAAPSDPAPSPPPSPHPSQALSSSWHPCLQNMPIMGPPLPVSGPPPLCPELLLPFLHACSTSRHGNFQMCRLGDFPAQALPWFPTVPRMPSKLLRGLPGRACGAWPPATGSSFCSSHSISFFPPLGVAMCCSLSGLLLTCLGPSRHWLLHSQSPFRGRAFCPRPVTPTLASVSPFPSQHQGLRETVLLGVHTALFPSPPADVPREGRGLSTL